VILQPTLEHYLVLSTCLFTLGVFILVTRRHGVRLLMGIELILNAANINLVAFNHYTATGLDGHIFAIFVMILAASEAAVALAIILAIYQQYANIDIDRMNSMRE